MYKKNLLFLFLLFVSPCLFAQEATPLCGLSAQSDQVLINRLRQHKETLLENPDIGQSEAGTYLPIVFHLVRKEEGIGGANPLEVLEQLCSLNDFFASQGTNIQFLLQEINTIIDFQAYFLHFEADGKQTLLDNRREKVINVFMLGDANSSDQSGGVTLAYYSSENDWIVIRRDEINGISETLAHEIGHFLSLPHPFRGWDFEPYDPATHGVQVGEFSPSTNFPNTIPNEKQDGSNCENAGDEICDTPPDYNHASIDWSCHYQGGAKDPNGTPIDPDEKNIMGYFISCAGKRFSELQKAFMGVDLFDRIINETISKGNASDGGILSKIPQPLSPVHGANKKDFSSIKFEWEAVENAQGYLLQIDDSPTFSFGTIERLVYETSYTLDSDFFEANKKYYWHIRAFNANTACADWSPRFSFTTDLSTATENIAPLQNSYLNPNPVKSGQEILLNFNKPLAKEARIALYDIRGQKLELERPELLPAGQRSFSLRLGELAPGVYVLVVNTGREVWKGEVVIF